MHRLTYIDWIGFVAGALTTFAYLPQLLRTWRSKCADDLSYAMLGILSAGVWLWCAYGIIIHSPPVFVANLLTGIFTCAILISKLRYHSRPRGARS